MPTVINNELIVLGKWYVVQYLNAMCRNGSHRAHVGNLVTLVLVESKEAQWVITSLSQRYVFATSSQQNTE